MSDLVSRLLAAIEETERLARAAQDYVGDGPWSVGRARGSGEPYVNGEVAAVCSFIEEASALHIVRNDPAAVLRRCAADRKLLARGGPFCSCYEYGPPTNPNTGLSIPHHYDCSSYEAASLLAEVYGISVEEEA